MANFRLGPSRLADWQNLVIDAEIQSGYQFEESLENYLVLTLDYFTTRNRLACGILAIKLFEAIKNQGQSGTNKLRDVGDRCLLLAGLFPEQALKKNVSLQYFVGIGKHAYHHIYLRENAGEQLDPELFKKLSLNFVGLMDVLHTMRHLPDFDW